MTQRKLIRRAVCDLLNDLSKIRDNVHASRSLPVAADLPFQLPCVLVYTDRDPADKTNDYTSQRNLALRIVVIVRNDEDADDQLDDLCELVEQAIDTALDGTQVIEPILATLVDSCDYVDTVLTYVGEEGRSEYVHAEITYTAKYYRTPEQSFDSLNTMQVDFDMSNPRNDPQSEIGPDGQIDATATIDLST